MSTGYEISDALIHAAKQAESLIERLLEENQRMKIAPLDVNVTTNDDDLLAELG